MAKIGVLIDPTKSRTLINSDLISVDFDVLIDESHEWTSEVTTNEVEEGAPIADHIRNQADKLSFTGHISNADLYPEVASLSSSESIGQIDNSGDTDRIQTTFDLLRELHESRTVVTVYTKHKIYTDMALTSCNIPRNAGIGDAMQFSLQFTKIRIVSTQTTQVPTGISNKNKTAAKKKTAAQKDAGKKKNTTPKRQTSILSGILNK